ncbi:hypothetical protein EV202_10278 [Bacteroides heparinolyticus]|uniref:Uncharacterized protein n=1 Tax=Prevotella heparinolytica TaxID=28113 RepID=A0A4R2LNY6_9BACE|nr:hypothetical protein EV202_10278 [Bacteroides heparinolyticus]
MTCLKMNTNSFLKQIAQYTDIFCYLCPLFFKTRI